MLRPLAVLGLAAVLIAPVLAQDMPAAPEAPATLDKKNPLKAMGGWMPQAVKSPDVKGVRAFIDQAYRTEDPEAEANLASFPVMMVTTDKDGVPATMTAGRAEYLKMMQMPEVAREAAKLVKHGRAQLTWITDTLVFVRTPMHVRSGGKTWRWHSGSLLIREKDGWKVKAMVEGGYGAMMPGQAND